MPATLGEKLSFVLRFLSLSRSQLAAELQVDKSIVGRWASGQVFPSSHNLARLTALVAQRVEGFNSLDWDRDLDGLAQRLGVETKPPASSLPGGLPLALMDQILAATALRASAYEGFFRSTRPYGAGPGRFVNDHALIRLADNGLMQLRMGTGGVTVEGWLLPLHNQLFCIATELTSGSLAFGIFNGVPSVRAEVIEGLILSPILDLGRTPTASAVVFERIGDLSGDAQADDARLQELANLEPVAAKGSVDPALATFLVRDIGPAAFAQGGDWLLRAPQGRSISRGRVTH